MKKQLLLSLSIVMLALTIHAAPELKGTPAELTRYLSDIPKTVSVTGEAEIKTPADRAIIKLLVSTEDRHLQAALESNTKIRQGLITILEKDGIAHGAIKGSRFSSTPQYGFFKDKAKSYQVDNLVRVSVQNEKEFQAVASLIDKHNEISYQGIEFECAKATQFKQDVIAQACEAATAKKHLFEDKLAVDLTIIQFEDRILNAGTPAWDQAEASRKRVSNRISGSYSRSPKGGSPQAIPFDELIFRAEVTLECELKESP